MMEEASGKNLSWFFNEWLDKPGLPYLDGKWNYNSNEKMLTLNLKQTQPYNNIFTMPIDIAVYTKNRSEPKLEKIEIDKRDNTINLKLDSVPVKVILDPGTWVLMKANLEEQ